MYILAIDTSGLYLSVAIAKDGKPIAVYNSRAERAHSGLLAPAAARLLKKSSLKAKDIDLYAISIGPGSFTGLRIGVAFIKGMNLFFDKPVACVPTLDIMAYNAVKFTAGAPPDFICPVVDAKRHNVYAAIYKVGKNKAAGMNINRITGYMVTGVSEVLKRLNAILYKEGSSILFTGDGIAVYRDEIAGVLAQRAEFSPSAAWYPKADMVAGLGYKMYEAGKCIKGVSRLAPMYLYPADIQCRRMSNE